MLVVVALLAGVFGTPVYFGDDNGVGVHHGDCLVELANQVVVVIMVVAATIPSGVVVYGIADVVAGDGIFGIAAIVALPSCSRYPDDAGEAVGANLIDDGLEIVVQGLVAVLPVGIGQVDGFVGQFQAEPSSSLLHRGVLAHNVPDLHEVLLIIVTHFQVARAHTGRTHDDIHAMFHGTLGDRVVKRRQVFLQACGVEVPDVGLASCAFGLRCGGSIVVAVVVCPAAIKVQAEQVAIRSLGGVGDSREDSVEVGLAVCHGVVVAGISPSVFIEVGAGGVHETVQDDRVSVLVFQLVPIDVQTADGSELGPCRCAQ